MRRAAWVVMTAEVDVSVSNDFCGVEFLYHERGIRVDEIVVMPCILVRVHKHRHIGKFVVVFYDICKIWHGFVTFIDWD